MPELVLAAIGTLAGVGSLIVAVVQYTLNNDRAGVAPPALIKWSELSYLAPVGIAITALMTVLSFVFDAPWPAVAIIPLLLVYLGLSCLFANEARREVKRAKTKDQFVARRLDSRTELANVVIDVLLLAVCASVVTYFATR